MFLFDKKLVCKFTCRYFYSTLKKQIAPSPKVDVWFNRPEITFNISEALILSVAIEFGALDAFGNPTPIRAAGAGKILGVG